MNKNTTLSECIDDLNALTALMSSYLNNEINIGSCTEEIQNDVMIFYDKISTDIISRMRMIDGQSTE